MSKICELYRESPEVEEYVEHKKQLASIRFVSRDLAYAAARELFHTIDFWSDERWITERDSKLVSVSRSAYAQFVGHVRVFVQPGRPNNFTEQLSGTSIEQKLSKYQRLFATVEHFINLTEFRLDLTNVEVEEGGAVAVCIERFLLKVTALRRLTALALTISPRINLPPMDHLTDLHLDWDCSSHKYAPDSDYGNEHQIDRRLRNNHLHALQSLTNLQSLSIEFSSELGVYADWLRPYDLPFTRLTKLVLQRTRLAAGVLTTLIDMNQQLLHFGVESILLSSGNWQDVFERLSLLPRLTSFEIGDCFHIGYANQGQAELDTMAENHEYLNRSESGSIRTHRWQDVHALGDLVRQIIARPGDGRKAGTKWWREYVHFDLAINFYRDLKPFEDVATGKAQPGDTIYEREKWNSWGVDRFESQGNWWHFNDECDEREASRRPRSMSVDNPAGHASCWIIGRGSCPMRRFSWLAMDEQQHLRGKYGYGAGCNARHGWISKTEDLTGECYQELLPNYKGLEEIRLS